VKIYTGTITEGGLQNVFFNPWHLYFNDAKIKRKLDNYGLIRCDMKIKIMLNASPFYYGHLLVSYEPLPLFNGGITDSTLTQRMIHYSQRPHLWLYPQESQGGEMTIPFFYHKNWLRVDTASDFTDMGAVNVSATIPLRNSNGVSGDSLEYQVYAWATNVTLAAPTTSMALQAGDVPKKKAGSKNQKPGKVSRSQGLGDVTYKANTKASKAIKISSGSGGSDEYGKGPISTVASAVSAATGALSDVPVIGPYMTATSFVAKTAADVASYFGYSNPPVLSNVLPFKDSPFHAMACPEISTPVEKLTLDPKNELCIDSRTVGLDGTDELSIESIVTRESHLEYFDWDDSDAADVLLYKMYVTPSLSKYVSGADGKIFGTPMAHLAQMFQFWRGDIIIRFQVVCTQYHRGRLLISWDPTKDITADSDTETVTYSRVYDIAQDRDFEIRIPYMQAEPWLKTRYKDYINERSGLSATSFDRNFENGALTVRVLTNLTAPTSPNTVSIAVSVRGAPNLTLASPQDYNTSYHNFGLQSADIPLASDQQPSDEEMKEVHCLGDPQDYVDKLYLITMGEAVKSLRPLLRRYSYSRNVMLDSDAASQFRQVKFRTGRFPLPNGRDPVGVNSSTDGPYNYAITSAFDWISNCFIGMRGSMNWRINVQSKQYIDNLTMIRLNGETRNSANPAVNGGVRYQYVGVGVTPDISARDDVIEGLYPRQPGGVLINQKTQTGLEVQLPMYSRYRMVSTDPSNRTLGVAYDDTNIDSFELQFRVNPASSTQNTNEVVVNYYAAIGTDFTFFFFLNVPLIHNVAVPSVA
jgi:hypothetical protein